MSDQVYFYRGIDAKGTPANGRILAGSQEQADNLVRAMGIKADFVGTSEPPKKPATPVTSIQPPAVLPSRPPALVKPPPPSQARGVPPELQKYVNDPMLPPPPQPQPLAPEAETIRVLTARGAQPTIYRRESLLFGEYNQVKDRLELLLDKHAGRILQLHMGNNMNGRQALAIVVEHEKEKRP